MGLFDKLRGVVDTAKDSVNKAVETAQNSINKAMATNDPLADLTVKKYFEIICGMRHTFLATGREAVTGNTKAKKYVEYFLDGPCDEEVLEKTLELYNISRTDYPNGKVEAALSDFRRSLKNATNYRMDRYEACKRFCQEEIAAATAEYKNVLHVIKDNVNYRHFSQGMKSISCNSAIKDIVVANSFCEGNPITQKLMVEYLIDSYIGRTNDATFNTLYDYHDDVAKLVLKALHFEKYGQKAEGYRTIIDEDYRDFVQKVGFYKRAVDDNPFEKEKYIAQFAKGIKAREVIYSAYTSFDEGSFHIGSVDDYFCDYLCNLTWKEAAKAKKWMDNGENISESKEADDVFRILCAYFEEQD